MSDKDEGSWGEFPKIPSIIQNGVVPHEDWPRKRGIAKVIALREAVEDFLDGLTNQLSGGELSLGYSTSWNDLLRRMPAQDVERHLQILHHLTSENKDEQHASSVKEVERDDQNRTRHRDHRCGYPR